MRFIPEGISKAGKKYNAFWGCDKECDTTIPIPEKEGHYMSMMVQMVKDKQIAYFNSVNAAVELVKGKASKEEIREWRDWFYEEWQKFYLKEIIEEE